MTEKNASGQRLRHTYLYRLPLERNLSLSHKRAKGNQNRWWCHKSQGGREFQKRWGLRKINIEGRWLALVITVTAHLQEDIFCGILESVEFWNHITRCWLNKEWEEGRKDAWRVRVVSLLNTSSGSNSSKIFFWTIAIAAGLLLLKVPIALRGYTTLYRGKIPYVMCFFIFW